MSKQLSLSAAFSILAMAACALFAPGSLHPSDLLAEKGATIATAAPPILAGKTEASVLPLIG